MRAKTLFTMALTPFILSAATQTEEPFCRSPFHVMHVDVRHTESKGVGYKDGYTTLEGFGIYDHNPYFMPFLDLRGHVFNDGKLAGNVGLGERTVIPSINHIFGLYLYYDVRQEEHGLTVNQLSPGIEMLGKRMEYRINAYFPVGDDESHSYQHKFDRFDGNRIVLKNKKKFAMTGVDAEVGAHITQSTRHDFYFGIGPYYFTADPNNAWGGKTRLYWRYKDYVSLEASYSYDHIFKNIVQGTVMFSYPFGPKLKRTGRNCPNGNDLALSRAAFAPYRFEIPVVETRKQHRNAVNPATGQPWRVWFVRNTSSSNGTYESPFSTLLAAQNASGPNDMIYVFQGDGTTRGMDAGIVLKNGQSLFGSGTKQTISTSVGRINIPAQTRGAPTITAPGDGIIFLANGNEISGMIVLDTFDGGMGALGGMSGQDIVGANIHDNVLQVFDDGIVIGSGSGTLRIVNNVLVSDLAAGVSTGIFVGLSDQFSDLNVSNNTLTNFQRGIDIRRSLLLPAGSNPSCNGLISGNQIFGYLQGVQIRTNIVNSTFSVVNNNLFSSRDGNLGIEIQPSNGSRYSIDRNTISNANGLTTAVGIMVDAVGAPAVASMSITNNQVTASGGATGYGITVSTAIAGNVYCANIANNRVALLNTAGVATGINLSGTSGTINVADFSNNITPSVSSTGTVNFVPAGTCGQ